MKQNPLMTKDHRLGLIRDLLINEYVGLSGRVGIKGNESGNESFRQKLLAIVEEFTPSVLMTMPYGFPSQLYSSSKEDSSQAVRNVIAQHNWEFVVTIRDWEGRPEDIQRYRQLIKDLATEYGLKPTEPSEGWWGYDWLHEAVSNTIQHLINTEVNLIEKRWWAGKSWGEFTPTRGFTPSTWEMSPWTDKDAEIKRILNEFERDWQEGVRYFGESGYAVPGDRQVLKHVRWLYLAICPEEQGGNIRTYQLIADEERFGDDPLDPSTVSKAVNWLATELQIDLQRGSGRPRRKS